MSATDEELNNVHDNGMDHVTYVLIMYRSVWWFHVSESLCQQRFSASRSCSTSSSTSWSICTKQADVMLHRILKVHWPQMKLAALNSAPLSPRVRAGIHACRLQAHPLKISSLILLQDMLLATTRIERCFCGSLFANGVHFYIIRAFVFHITTYFYCGFRTWFCS